MLIVVSREVRSVREYITEISAGLINVRELHSFLLLDEKIQVQCCLRAGLDAVTTVRHALRLYGSWISSYQELRGEVSEQVRIRYYLNEIYDGKVEPMIVFNAAWSLRYVYSNSTLEDIDTMSRSKDWKERLMAAFVTSSMSSTSNDMIKELKARLRSDAYVTTQGQHLVRMAANGIP